MNAPSTADSLTNDMLIPQDWSFPIPIAYGPGRFSEIGIRCAKMGITNPLIVTDKGSRDFCPLSPLWRASGSGWIGLCGFFPIYLPTRAMKRLPLEKVAFNKGSHDAVIAIAAAVPWMGVNRFVRPHGSISICGCSTGINRLVELGPDQAFPS